MNNAARQMRRRPWHLPALLMASGLSAGLLVDTYQAWALSGQVKDCHPPFAVLYIGNQHYTGAPTRVDKQAVLAWERQVAKKYGPPYANFDHAKGADTGVKPCYPQLDGGPQYCGFASGQPCRRMDVTAEMPRLLLPRPGIR